MRKIFYGWWIVFACFFIYFYISGTVYSFTAFFEPISREFGWSYTKISIAASIRGLELGIFAPIMGILVDRFGSRKLLFWGTFTIGLGLIFLSLTNSLTLFYGASVVFALGLSATTGTVIVPAVANWFTKDMGKALGIISAGFGAGGLLVPVTVSIINFFQWRITFFILGIGIWLFGVPLILIVRQRPKPSGTVFDEKSSEIQVAVDADKDSEMTLKEAIKNRNFWYISLADAVRMMSVSALITHVIPYLSSLSISRSKAAFVATSIPLLSIIGRLVFGWLGDIIKKNYVMALAYLFAGVSLVAFAYAQIPGLITIFLILFPLSWGASPLRGAIMREYFGVTSLGSILGILAAIGTVPRILGPSLAGWTYDTFGHYQLIWLFLAGTFAIAILLILAVKKRPNK